MKTFRISNQWLARFCAGLAAIVAVLFVATQARAATVSYVFESFSGEDSAQIILPLFNAELGTLQRVLLSAKVDAQGGLSSPPQELARGSIRVTLSGSAPVAFMREGFFSANCPAGFGCGLLATAAFDLDQTDAGELTAFVGSGTFAFTARAVVEGRRARFDSLDLNGRVTYYYAPALNEVSAPSSLALAGLGMLGVFWGSRRRRRPLDF